MNANVSECGTQSLLFANCRSGWSVTCTVTVDDGSYFVNVENIGKLGTAAV